MSRDLTTALMDTQDTYNILTTQANVPNRSKTKIVTDFLSSRVWKGWVVTRIDLADTALRGLFRLPSSIAEAIYNVPVAFVGCLFTNQDGTSFRPRGDLKDRVKEVGTNLWELVDGVAGVVYPHLAIKLEAYRAQTLKCIETRWDKMFNPQQAPQPANGPAIPTNTKHFFQFWK